MAGSGRVRPVLAGMYLFDALQAVRNAGSADTLHDADIRKNPLAHELEWVQRLAGYRRLGYSRTALLLAAFAAEAYINEFLSARMARREFDAIDRLGTPDKYALGPELVLGRRLLARGENPLQSISTLFSAAEPARASEGR